MRLLSIFHYVIVFVASSKVGFRFLSRISIMLKVCSLLLLKRPLDDLL